MSAGTADERVYRIEAPGLAAALEAVRNGIHVHLFNGDDDTDRMCSANPPCVGHDRFYLEASRG